VNIEHSNTQILKHPLPNVFQNLTPNPLSYEERGLFVLFFPLLVGEGPGVRSNKNC